MIVLNYWAIMIMFLQISVDVVHYYENFCLEKLDNNYYIVSFMISHIMVSQN